MLTFIAIEKDQSPFSFSGGRFLPLFRLDLVFSILIY